MREVTTHYPFHEENCSYRLIFVMSEGCFMVEYTGEGCTNTYSKLDGTVIKGEEDENYYMF